MADTNPKAFWDTVKTISKTQSDTTPSADAIPPDIWLDHFKKLGVSENNHEDPELMKELIKKTNVANAEYDKMLNSPITISEIKAIIKLLKNNKASSDDLIIN